MRDDDFDRREDMIEDDDDRPQGNSPAIVALVMGVISLACGLFSGIPAIIFGVIGVSRAKRLRGQGQVMAIIGIVLGGFSIVSTMVLLGLMLPAVQKVRQAASRVQGMNNAKQVSMGLFNYDGQYGMPRAVYDPNRVQLPPGQGLSWRVGLLPFLEQQNLHRSFNLSESWDSPSNRPLSDTVVMSFTNADEVTNMTRFQAFVGPRSVFDPELKNVSLVSPAWIPDGTSNTLIFAESGLPVPWAAPKDIPYSPNGPLPAMGRPGQSTFLAAMADGSVRHINKNVPPNILHAIIQRDEGSVVPLNWED